MGSIPGLGRSPGGGHGSSLQCSCLENPRDRGALWAVVHGMSKSRTLLKRLSTHALTGLGDPCMHASVSERAEVSASSLAGWPALGGRPEALTSDLSCCFILYKREGLNNCKGFFTVYISHIFQITFAFISRFHYD